MKVPPLESSQVAASAATGLVKQNHLSERLGKKVQSNLHLEQQQQHASLASQSNAKMLLQGPGYRSTIFTNLSSSSYQSVAAAASKKELREYMNVRVDPPIAIIHDYEPGYEFTR
jgi:hypothetical protein